MKDSKKKDEEKAVEEKEEAKAEGPSRGISLIDLILRIVAAISILGSSIAMRPTNQKYAFSMQLVSLTAAHYDNLPTFKFFFVTNAIVCAYLALSLLLSVLHILMRRIRVTRSILIICDTVMVVLLTSGGSAAAAIVQLAHQGNDGVNWDAICHQNISSCGRVTGSLVGSFIGVFVLVLTILFSVIALSRC